MEILDSWLVVGGVVFAVIVLVTCAAVFMARGLQTQKEPTEIVKQVGVGIAIAALTPLAAWYGTSVFWPPPDWKEYRKQNERMQTREMSAAREEKEKAEGLRERREQREDEMDEAEKVYYRAMFRVCYPVGLAALVIGLFFPVQVAGAGLLFGGLFTLTAGCYSYWDRMDGWTRFGSLLLALTLLLVLSTWRYSRRREANAP